MGTVSCLTLEEALQDSRPRFRVRVRIMMRNIS